MCRCNKIDCRIDLGAVHNYQCTEHTLLGEINGEKRILYTFNIIAYFFIISMANYTFEKCGYVHLLRGIGESVRFVHSFKCWQLWMDPYITIKEEKLYIDKCTYNLQF